VRSLAEERCAAAGIELRIPLLSLCTDNGAMIAALGAELIRRGRPGSDMSVSAEPTLNASIPQAGLPVQAALPPNTEESPLDDEDPLEHAEKVDEAFTGLVPKVAPSSRRERKGQSTWLGTIALSLGILGLALSPAFGVGVVPAILAVVFGHVSLGREEKRRGSVVIAVIAGYLGIAVSTVVGVILATPVIRSLLVAAGFLLN
jgi:hypothetical protein